MPSKLYFCLFSSELRVGGDALFNAFCSSKILFSGNSIQNQLIMSPISVKLHGKWQKKMIDWIFAWSVEWLSTLTIHSWWKCFRRVLLHSTFEVLNLVLRGLKFGKINSISKWRSCVRPFLQSALQLSEFFALLRYVSTFEWRVFSIGVPLLHSWSPQFWKELPKKVQDR